MRNATTWSLLAVVLSGLACKPSGPSASNDGAASPSVEATEQARLEPVEGQARILIVSSYHREYLWSQDTNKGICAALEEFGYFEPGDAETFWKNDIIEKPNVVVKKLWMDSKRKTSEPEIAEAVGRVMKEAEAFAPHIILLGDDNAANYVGNKFLDTDTPVVFWGINGLPVKYGLLETLDEPGHNVTGVYQAGYLKECVAFLKKVTPGIETMGVLSDDSPTGRAKAKALQFLGEKNEIPVRIEGVVVTNSADEWKSGALELAKKVDSMFVLNHNTLKDGAGKSVDPLELGAWYLRHVKKPDCAQERQFAEEGLLATADDSGFNQGYEAMKIAHDILSKGTDPATIPVRAPERGPLILNRERAKSLGIAITDEMGAEEFVDHSLALQKFPR